MFFLSGMKKTFAFTSSTISKAEQNHLQIETEALGKVWEWEIPLISLWKELCPTNQSFTSDNHPESSQRCFLNASCQLQ